MSYNCSLDVIVMLKGKANYFMSYFYKIKDEILCKNRVILICRLSRYFRHKILAEDL